MRRADRLFQIVQYLRSGRLLTARILAERLEVSERTIYRDIADLQASGVPIDGEAGIGYLMRDGYDLPPLMFTREEIAALIISARITSAWGGVKMALAAQTALEKIETVLPDDMKQSADSTSVFAFGFQVPETIRTAIDDLNLAIGDRRTVYLDYADESGARTERSVEPLALYFWGKVWTLVGWCRLREDFRMFRIDRISALDVTEERFKPQQGRTLRDFLVRMKREGDDPSSPACNRPHGQ